MLGMTLVTTPDGDLSETAIGLDFITNVAGGASKVKWPVQTEQIVSKATNMMALSGAWSRGTRTLRPQPIP